MNNPNTLNRLSCNFNRLFTLSVTVACTTTAIALNTVNSATANSFFSSQNLSQTLIMGSPSSSQSNCLQSSQSLPGMNQSSTMCSPQSGSTGGITIGGIRFGGSQTTSSISSVNTGGSKCVVSIDSYANSLNNGINPFSNCLSSQTNSTVTIGNSQTNSQTSSQTSNISSQCLTSSQSLNQGSSITQIGTMCAPQAPVTVINTSGSSNNSQITIGSSQSNPVLPTAILRSGVFSFINVSRRLWIDPPTAPGFRYTMTGDSLFTSILDFPTGIDSDNLFNVSVGDRFLGQFSPGQTVDFISLLGNGVREFTVSGIDPLVDPDNPSAFPIQLDFNTETASFEQIALSAEEVHSKRVPEPSSTLGLIAFAAFGIGSQFVFKHKRA